MIIKKKSGYRTLVYEVCRSTPLHSQLQLVLDPLRLKSLFANFFLDHREHYFSKKELAHHLNDFSIFLCFVFAQYLLVSTIFRLSSQSSTTYSLG